MRYALKYDVKPSLKLISGEIDLSRILHPLICEGTTDLISYDWKLPAFRHLGPYIHLDRLRSDQWRWEFLRRNILYRLTWLFRGSERFEVAFRSYAGDRDEFFSRFIYKLFGLRNFPDPRISSLEFNNLNRLNPPQCASFLDENPNNEHRFADYDFENLIFSQMNEILEYKQRNKEAIFVALHPNEDIGKQLKKIERYFSLDADQEALKRAKARRENAVQRKTRSMWPLYLAVLDARDGYASWSQIAELLPQKEIASRRHAARDCWDAADRVRRNFASVI